jgi:hypothetical protein
MPDGKYILSRLFIAIPELQIDRALLAILKQEGLVSERDLSAASTVRSKSKKYADIASRMRGKTVVERIMLVAPEIMSATTIDALRRWDLIDVTLGNALRVGLRAGKAISPGEVADKTALERWAGLGKSVLSFDTINLIRDLDKARIDQLSRSLPDLPENEEAMRELLRISVLRGNQLRSLLSAGRLTAETLALAGKADSIWGIMTLVAEGVLSDRLLKDAIRVGVISQSRYELISALSKLGLNIWKKGVKTIEFDSLEARMLLMSEGILSPEMINALRAAKIISPELARILYPAAQGIRAITRGRLANHMKGVRIRVVPGESPIRTYARLTGATDREILKLLAQAAKEAREEAERLMKGAQFGKLTRAQQQRLVENAMHLKMREVWEGVGHLTIFGEKESARAALGSMDFLQNKLWGKGGKDFRRTIQRESENGIDAWLSRQENLKGFSRRVYKNHALARDLVSRRVNIGLLRGLSARELAADVSGLIRPGVRGGVSYNAMRLARTEINNAFHFTSIRYTREMPWVSGYKWNLSGSHGKPDICNTYSQQNGEGLGRGVFKKSNVPGKPHPNCLCYVTTVTADNSTFEKRLTSGAYDPYLNSLQKSGSFPEANSWNKAYQEQARNLTADVGSALMIQAARSIGPAAISAAIQIAFS